MSVRDRPAYANPALVTDRMYRGPHRRLGWPIHIKDFAITRQPLHQSCRQCLAPQEKFSHALSTAGQYLVSLRYFRGCSKVLERNAWKRTARQRTSVFRKLPEDPCGDLRKSRGNLPGLMERRSMCGRMARWWQRNRDPTDSNFVNSYFTTMLESWAGSRSSTPKPPFLLRYVSPPSTLAV